MSDVVHLIQKHPTAKKFATLVSPLGQVATGCLSHWTTRPRTTFVTTLVTCDACKLFIAAHQLSGLWWKEAA